MIVSIVFAAIAILAFVGACVFDRVGIPFMFISAVSYCLAAASFITGWLA